MGLKSVLLERCKNEGTPLLEDGRAVFVWFGDTAPHLVGDFNNWDRQAALDLKYVEKGVWVGELPLPDDAYMEYIFMNAAGERAYDRFNRNKISNGMGKTNQFFYMPQGKPTEWLLLPQAGLRGELTEQILDGGGLVAGGKRKVHFYQPPAADPVPLLVVWDGGDYLRRAQLVTMVDNLIAAGKIGPLALALPENGGHARFLEYACSEATLGFLHWVLLPEARRCLHLLNPEENPGAYGVLGASLGGLMALYTGLRLPHIFGHVLAQSGAYEIDGFEFVTSTLAAHLPPVPVQIWMDVGQFEPLVASNRNMVNLLEAQGYAPDYHEYPAGHNYSAWRDDLPGGLECLFGEN